MPIESHYTPDPAFFRVHDGLADPVEPAAFAAPVVRWRDNTAAGEVGLAGLTDAEWVDHFAHFQPLPENQSQPLAMRYHGHQFRHYNPQIGDGRGFLFAQMRDRSGALMDLGTKGSGQTPYSRTGDGRMTLQGGVREALVGAYLHALGVKSCRILSLIETGEQITRYDEPSPTRGGVMVRYQNSHIRIGHFQRHAYHEDADSIRALLDHCIHAYFPQLADVAEAEKPAQFLRQVCVANADMVGGWMAAGFVHGVMNSDNVTVTGTSFDYGPSRCLPVYEPEFTAAYFDQDGTYAYGRQGEAMMWNLQRLAEALATIAAPGSLERPLEQALGVFPDAFKNATARAFVRRLGLESRGDVADHALAAALSRFAFESRVPFAGLMFDWAGGLASEARALDGTRANVYRGPAFREFRSCLADYAPVAGLDLAHAYFTAPNHLDSDHVPFAPRIDRLHAIWDAIDRDDDWSPFHRAMAGIDHLRGAMGR